MPSRFARTFCLCTRPTTTHFMNGIRASHGGSSTRRTGFLAYARPLRGAPLCASLLSRFAANHSMECALRAARAIELRSTIPWRALYAPGRRAFNTLAFVGLALLVLLLGCLLLRLLLLGSCLLRLLRFVGLI